MPVTVYKSTDSGAPTLTGQVGSLINVLRACLVDGYGSKSPAGWSMPYTDGNNPPRRAHFRQASKTGWDQYDLEVKDDGNTSGGSNNPVFAELWGWAGATGLASGDVSFPLRTGVGGLPRKSASADATPRRWLIVATPRSFYAVLYHQASGNAAGGEVLFFGDLLPVGATDIWAVALFSGNATWWSPGLAHFADFTRHAPYTFQGAPGPVPLSRIWPAGVHTQDEVVGNGHFQYPNGPDGRGYIDRVLILDSGHLRAVLPGLWAPLHNWKQAAAIYDWQELSGSGSLNGRSFIVAKWGNGGATFGTVAFALETSDTWYEL